MLKMEATIEVGDQTKVLSFESDEPVIMIGRESKNDFQIPLTTVSRQHCRISLEDDQYFIEDLGAKTPSFLNGKEIPKNGVKRLKDRDEIMIGSVKILFIDPDAELLRSLSGIPGFEPEPDPEPDPPPAEEAPAEAPAENA